MAGALYLMTKNDMIDPYLLGTMFVVLFAVFLVGGLVVLVDWVKTRFLK